MAARFNGIAVPFDDLSQWISRVDVVITSTGASEMLDRPIHGSASDARSQKRADSVYRHIGSPKIDPGIGTIANVFCYDIDDLAAVVEANLHQRLKAAAKAEKNCGIRRSRRFAPKLNPVMWDPSFNRFRAGSRRSAKPSSTDISGNRVAGTEACAGARNYDFAHCGKNCASAGHTAEKRPGFAERVCLHGSD